jgi:CheY-like chemotaxis protein
MISENPVAQPPHYDLSRLSILVVDDSKETRRLVCDQLRGLGVGRLLEAADGESALEILARDWIDLLISDWIMAPVDGLELVRTIRAGSDDQKAMLPIILMTAYGDQPRLLAARDAGVNEILLKPFDPERLHRKLMAVIEAPRAFVRSPVYIGPDRRSFRDIAFAGLERRIADMPTNPDPTRPKGTKRGKALH